jgi:nocturnin
MSSNVGPDGCAIFYKANKFRIHNLHCENICVNDVNHSQVFVVLQLEHLSSKKLLTIVCLHLKSKIPSANKRTEQMEYILKILKRHLNTVKDLDKHPIIVCGDFNGEPYEKFYSLIMSDDILSFENSYIGCVDSDGKDLPSTFKIREPNGLISRTIDYIFYTKKSLNLIQYLKLPNTNEIDALPNLSYPSDHLSLCCDFELI